MGILWVPPETPPIKVCNDFHELSSAWRNFSSRFGEDRIQWLNPKRLFFVVDGGVELLINSHNQTIYIIIYIIYIYMNHELILMIID